MEEGNKRQPLKVVPLTQVPEVSGYEWLTPSMLRHWVFQSRGKMAADGTIVGGNGFEFCLLRIGRKILIDLDRFDEWISEHRQA